MLAGADRLDAPVRWVHAVELTDGIARLLQSEPVYAHRFTGRRFDCGNKLGYLQATVELSLIHPVLGEAFRRYLRGVTARLRDQD